MLYLDGEVLLDQLVKGDLSQNEEPLHIGDALNMRHFNGLIDEVRIYNRGLTPAEAKQNFEIKSNNLSVRVAGKITTVWARLKRNWFLKIKITQAFTESLIYLFMTWTGRQSPMLIFQIIGAKSHQLKVKVKRNRFNQSTK